MTPFAKKICTVFALIWFTSIQIVCAQTTPFTASWNFENTDNGTSSSGLVAASSFSYSGVNRTLGTFFAGYVDLGNSIQHWSTTGCNNSEYGEFSVQPQGTAQITLTSLSFAFAHSTEGPTQIMVRSSVDGFSSDLFSQAVTNNYQIASITLSNPGFSNRAGSITFRIYACSASNTGGTLKLDEIQINATVLPVTLLSFTAQSEGDRVQLAWSTTAEYNADRFVIERSRDLGEYTTVGEVAAKGTTDSRQYYGLTDLNPQPGINYYRLKQIDYDGREQSFRPISIILRPTEPVITVYPNPASPDRIHVRLWNADEANVQLLTASGQFINGLLDKKAGAVDLIFTQPLPIGLYWLDVHVKDQHYKIKVLIDK